MSIDELTNQSCFVNASGNILFSSSRLRRFILEIGWQYNLDGTRSSLTLLTGSLTANQTYQIRADLVSRQDPSRLYTGYVTVKVQSADSIEVSVGYVSLFHHAIHNNRSSRCVLPELCPSVDVYRLINSDTQAAFTSLNSMNLSLSNCTIAWQVYAGRMNSSIQWTLLENTTHYIGRWFFGMLMSISVPVTIFSFRTECEKLHLHSRSVSHLSDRRVLARPSYLLGWGDKRIECTRPEDELPSGEWHLFSQSFEWNDQHVIHCQLCELDRLRWHQRLLVLRLAAVPSLDSEQNLSLNLLAWTNDRPTRSLVGFSTSSSMDARLPPGDHSNSTLVYLSVRVRDEYGCSFQLDMPPVSITRDTTTIAMLINALVQTLINGNQNEVNQVLVSLAQMLNTMSTDALQTALMNAANIPATDLSVSSLDHHLSPLKSNNSSSAMNSSSALAEYNRQRNQVATVLDYLMTFVSNLPIGGVDSITLQSSTLAELTKSTSALTRDATVRDCFIQTTAMTCFNLN